MWIVHFLQFAIVSRGMHRRVATNNFLHRKWSYVHFANNFPHPSRSAPVAIDRTLVVCSSFSTPAIASKRVRLFCGWHHSCDASMHQFTPCLWIFLHTEFLWCGIGMSCVTLNKSPLPRAYTAVCSTPQGKIYSYLVHFRNGIVHFWRQNTRSPGTLCVPKIWKYKICLAKTMWLTSNVFLNVLRLKEQKVFLVVHLLWN